MAVHSFICRVAEKMFPLVAIVTFLLAGLGAGVISRDMNTLGAESRLRVEREKIEESLGEVQRRIDQLEVDIPPAQERVIRSEKVVAQLEQLKSTWSWFGGNREQQRANARRLQDMRALHAAAAAKSAGLQQELRRTRWERDGHEIERDRVDRELRAAEARKATAGYRVERAWLWARGWILIGLAGYLGGAVLAPAGWKKWRRQAP